jgi:hypothetical protein
VLRRPVLGRKAVSEENDFREPTVIFSLVVFGISLTAATKAIPTEVSPRSTSVFALGVPSQATRSRPEILLVHTSDSLSICHTLIIVGKIFSTTVLKALARSSRY